MKKLLVPVIYLRDGKAVSGFGSETVISELPVEELAADFSDRGADELLVLDFSKSDAEHDQAISALIRICDRAEVPVIGGGNVRRMEDVKKILYAGCKKAVLNFSKESNCELLEEVSGKFGKEKIAVFVPDVQVLQRYRERIETFACMVFCDEQQLEEIAGACALPLMVLAADDTAADLLSNPQVEAVTGAGVSSPGQDLMECKTACREAGIPVNTFESSIPWSEFKKNSDGMVPVIVQDYQTDEVLMLAYMNEEAYETTLKTGRMTYWSRSRNELWMKGLTSGHFQYVKSLTLDCDKDTILAKVSQVGAACHTGNRSCFFQ